MAPTSPDTVSLQDLAAILKRRGRMILITFILIAAGVATATFLMPRQYETHMKILVKNERADMIVSADRNGSSGYHGEVSEAQINSEIELLNSADLLRQVVEKCGMARLESSVESASADRGPIMFEKAVTRLHHDLKISPVRKANIIQVDYAAADPQLAAAVLRQLMESYLDAHLKVHGTPGTYEFFKTQAARYQNELKQAEMKLAAFRQRENIIVVGQQRDTMLQKASDAESALMQSEAGIGEYTQKIADTRRQLTAAQARVVTQTRTVPNQYSVERFHTMLAELQNRRTQLLAKFRPEDRLVQEVSQEIADTQAALLKAEKLVGTEESTDVNPVHQSLQLDLARQQSELAGLQAKRQALVQQKAVLRSNLLKLANAADAYDDLVRDQKGAEDNYLLYVKKVEEARIADSLDQQKIANVAIAEAPVEPHLPSKPNVRLTLALGMLLAGFISLGGAFAAEYYRDTVATRSELESLTGLQVLATPMPQSGD